MGADQILKEFWRLRSQLFSASRISQCTSSSENYREESKSAPSGKQECATRGNLDAWHFYKQGTILIYNDMGKSGLMQSCALKTAVRMLFSRPLHPNDALTRSANAGAGAWPAVPLPFAKVT